MSQGALIQVSVLNDKVAYMRRHNRIILVSLLLIGVLAACGSATSPTPTNRDPVSDASAPGANATSAATGGAMQRSEGGQVTVEATWGGPAAGAAFEVKLDTHAVDLDAIDLANAVLRNDRGETLAASPWAAPRGGHHREGSLTFDGDVSSFLAGAKSIELVLTGVGDIPERTLLWQIGP